MLTHKETTTVIFVYYYHYRTEASSVIVSAAAVAERTVVVTSIINRVVDRQQAVVHPFVDENTYNDYDSPRQAVVQLFSLFDDDDENSNDYEL